MTRMHVSNPEGSPAQQGFTLIEMLATLTIFALALSAVATSLIRRNNHPAPLQVAEQVQAMVYRARSDAIGARRSTTIIMDTQQRRFSYGSLPPVELADGQEMRIFTGQELISESGEVFLVFLADGSSSGAEITLSDRQKRSAKLSVHWLTGLHTLSTGAEE